MAKLSAAAKKWIESPESLAKKRTSKDSSLARTCPSHGSGYYITGVNFEGPTPRPLERFAISKDSDGFVVVDMTRVFRSELGEWESPDSFVSLG